MECGGRRWNEGGSKCVGRERVREFEGEYKKREYGRGREVGELMEEG